MKALNIMKEISYKSPALLALILVFSWGCEEKENMDPLGNWEMTAPTPATPAADAAVVLDEGTPDAEVTFEWMPATTTNRFGVAYTFLLVPEGSDDHENALIRMTPDNRGRETFVSPTAAEIDYALWAACYPPGSTVDLEWVVIAHAIDKESVATQRVSVTRFDTDYEPTTLFVLGAGTEAGDQATNATPMRAHIDADGNQTGVFDVYTTLTSGGTYYFRDKPAMNSGTYGGADGTLERCGQPITAPSTGQYRITVDLNEGTYDLLPIEHWSLVGDAVEGGWGGDVPLTYQGNGVWGGEVEFFQPYETAGFAFRANGDWSYLLKREKGTATADNKGGKLVMESEAGASGVEFEDIPGTLGLHTVTLNLTADGYTYSLVEVDQGPPAQSIIGQSNNPDGDAVAGSFNIVDQPAPDAVFLLSEGDVVAEFVKDDDVFTSGKYLALQADKTYSLNTSADGTGEAIVAGDIGVARDQAYTIQIDFATGKLSWKYYNMKLFHWDEAGGGWDARDEFVMTYVHPYIFEVTEDLVGGYHIKFNSPWEVQFGTASTSLTGTMENVDGGPNFKGITQSGTYLARIVVADDYRTAEYSFVKQ